MNIGGRIYFDLKTGTPILRTPEIYAPNGGIKETTVEQDFDSYQVLVERVLETVGVIQLDYGQYTQDFAECNGYRVNVELYDTLPEDRKHEALEFSYPDPNDPEPQEPVYQKPLSEQVKELETRTADIELALADIMLGGM